jgi:vancomycin permeability regulator SanA
MKKAILGLLAWSALAVAIIGGIDLYMRSFNALYIRDHVRDIPQVRAMLLLGTSRHASSGGKNWYYIYRVRAAAELYRHKKAADILVSGDGRSRFAESRPCRSERPEYLRFHMAARESSFLAQKLYHCHSEIPVGPGRFSGARHGS